VGLDRSTAPSERPEVYLKEKVLLLPPPSVSFAPRFDASGALVPTASLDCVGVLVRMLWRAAFISSARCCPLASYTHSKSLREDRGLWLLARPKSLASWPHHLPPGARVSDHNQHHLDFLPSYCDQIRDIMLVIFPHILALRTSQAYEGVDRPLWPCAGMEALEKEPSPRSTSPKRVEIEATRPSSPSGPVGCPRIVMSDKGVVYLWTPVPDSEK
jgi:hypothetical protein